MQINLQDKIVEILSVIQTAVGKTADFAMEQLPDIAQQYVLYGRVVSAAWLTLWVCIGIASFVMSRWAYKNPWNGSPYEYDKKVYSRGEGNLIVMVGGFLVGISSFLFGVATFDFLVWFAPKVWLIKEIAVLIK